MKIGRGVSELWGGRKSPSPIDLAHGLYNSLYYRTSRDTFITQTGSTMCIYLKKDEKSHQYTNKKLYKPFQNADHPEYFIREREYSHTVKHCIYKIFSGFYCLIIHILWIKTVLSLAINFWKKFHFFCSIRN